MGSSTWVIVWCSVLCCSLVQTACAGPAKKFTPADVFTDGDIYKNGPYKVKCFTNVPSVLKSCPLMVAMPQDQGVYPVVQFQHGTALRNTEYSTLICRIASWGFIVVAPQMYNPSWKLPWPDASSEIQDASKILRWMKTGLLLAMRAQGSQAAPDFTKVALAGHSRGGLVVLALARLRDNSTERLYSAVVGLDPVDGKWPFFKPYLLKDAKPDSLDVGVPTLIVGTGLGPEGFACAPTDRGHAYWYQDVMAPSFHFVVPEYGHMDFMDDKCKIGRLFKPISFGCKTAPCKGTSLPSRQPMREFAGGIVVAFLQKVLLHNGSAFDAAYNHTKLAPVDLNKPESKPGKVSAVLDMAYS